MAKCQGVEESVRKFLLHPPNPHHPTSNPKISTPLTRKYCTIFYNTNEHHKCTFDPTAPQFSNTLSLTSFGDCAVGYVAGASR